MDSVAHGALGGIDWSAHGPLVRAHYGGQAASRDGLSRLPGHHPVSSEVLAAARRGGLRTRSAHGRVPLQERGIDLEELTRSNTRVITTARVHAAPRQPPRRRVLRIGHAMLQEPMMEKLTALRLLGMLDALKTQEQDPASRELSFLERLGLMVDQQWSCR